jgi:hypothetical protein
MTSTTYRWAAVGDINAFFGLMLDNTVNLALLAGILVFGFGFPADLVYTRMFPGTALGVMVGDRGDGSHNYSENATAFLHPLGESTAGITPFVRVRRDPSRAIIRDAWQRASRMRPRTHRGSNTHVQGGPMYPRVRYSGIIVAVVALAARGRSRTDAMRR